MEAEFEDDLRLLTNALRQETFRFILIGHNRYSLYVDIAARIRSTYPDRTVELRLTGKDYRQITDEIIAIDTKIVLIPDFGWLFRTGNEDTCVAFNQRRDAFAKLNNAYICFIEPNEFTKVPNKVPDWWSLRSLELDFFREDGEYINPFHSLVTDEYLSISDLSKEEKEAELGRLITQSKDADSSNKSLLSSLYLQIGNILHELSFFDESMKYLKQSLSLSIEINDKQKIGSSLNNIGQLYSYTEEYNLALEYFQQSLQIKQETEDLSGTANVLNNISQVYDSLKDYDKTRELLKISLDIQRQIGDKRGESRTLNNISALSYFQRDYSTALNYLEQSLTIQEQINDLYGKGATLQNMGELHGALGNYSHALSYLQQSLEVRESNGDQKGESSTLNSIGRIYDVMGDKISSITYYEMSLEIKIRIGDLRGAAITLTNIGVTYLEIDRDYEKAAPVFKQAVDIFERIGSPDVKFPQDYLNYIREQIGEEQYNQLIQST